MKLHFRSIALGIILLVYLISTPASAAGAKIFEPYDNSKVIYGYLENGVTYIPVGEIWHQFGMGLSFNAAEQKIYFIASQGTASLEVQSGIAELNGDTFTLSREPKKIQGRFYVPVRDMAQLLGMKFQYTDKSKLELALGAKKLLIQVKPITSAYLYQPNKIDVLMYHHFDPGYADSLTVTPERFQEHLDALIEEGYETITEEDLYQYKTNPHYKLPKKPLLITIDDGYESNYTIAYPILKEKGLRATIYVITSSRGKQPATLQHFSWENAREMYDSGVINIESHTHNLHHYVPQGKTEKAAILARHDGEDADSYKNRILTDLITSRDLILEHVGKESIALSFPYGVYDQTAIELAKEAGFKLLITTKADKNLRDGTLLINRMNVDGNYTSEQLISKLK